MTKTRKFIEQETGITIGKDIDNIQHWLKTQPHETIQAVNNAIDKYLEIRNAQRNK